MTATTNERRHRTMAEREMSRLLERNDIAPNAENVSVLLDYRRRTHRAHWWGVIGAVVVGALGYLGTNEGSSLGFARILIGYLVGSAAAEVLSPQRSAEGTVHAATLVTRSPDQLVPRWGRWLPWFTLTPCLAAPLLILGDHPTGTTRIHDHTGFVETRATWISTPWLISVAVLAALGLVFWRLSLHRLARRRLPADRPGAARLDLLTRALSARSIAGTASALGLFLLGSSASLVAEALRSTTCTSVTVCHYVYSWHSSSGRFESFGILAFAAIFVFLVSRIRWRVDPALLGPVTEPRT